MLFVLLCVYNQSLGLLRGINPWERIITYVSGHDRSLFFNCSGSCLSAPVLALSAACGKRLFPGRPCLQNLLWILEDVPLVVFQPLLSVAVAMHAVVQQEGSLWSTLAMLAIVVLGHHALQ